MQTKPEPFHKEEVHLLLLSELPEKLLNYELKYFVDKQENFASIQNIPFVYRGNIRSIRDNLAYDADDFNEEDLSLYYPLIKSFIRKEENRYELIYVPKKVLKRKLFSQTKPTK